MLLKVILIDKNVYNLLYIKEIMAENNLSDKLKEFAAHLHEEMEKYDSSSRTKSDVSVSSMARTYEIVIRKFYRSFPEIEEVMKKEEPGKIEYLRKLI